MDDPLLARANNAELIRDALVIIFHDAERLPFITSVLRRANFLFNFFHVRLFIAPNFQGICTSNRIDVQKVEEEKKKSETA